MDIGASVFVALMGQQYCISLSIGIFHLQFLCRCFLVTNAILCNGVIGMVSGKQTHQTQNTVCALLFFHDELFRLSRIVQAFKKNSKRCVGTGKKKIKMIETSWK